MEWVEVVWNTHRLCEIRDSKNGISWRLYNPSTGNKASTERHGVTLKKITTVNRWQCHQLWRRSLRSIVRIVTFGSTVSQLGHPKGGIPHSHRLSNSCCYPCCWILSSNYEIWLKMAVVCGHALTCRWTPGLVLVFDPWLVSVIHGWWCRWCY